MPVKNRVPLGVLESQQLLLLEALRKAHEIAAPGRPMKGGVARPAS